MSFARRNLGLGPERQVMGAGAGALTEEHDNSPDWGLEDDNPRMPVRVDVLGVISKQIGSSRGYDHSKIELYVVLSVYI